MTSWFSDITGKAENLLTKLDQSAANAFHTDQPSSSLTPIETKDLPAPNINPNIVITQASSLSYSKSVPSNLSSLNSKQSSPKSVSKTLKPSKFNRDATSDDALFEFLNSSDSIQIRKLSSDANQHSRNSSMSSLKSGKSEADSKSAPELTEDITNNTEVNQETKSVHNLSKTVDVVDSNPNYEAESTITEDNELNENDRISSLELENRLLQSEIASLNQEVTSLVERGKDSQDVISQLRQKLQSYNESASYADQMVREMQARESDLTESLAAKDSQLAVLRVRLEEADHLVEERTKLVDNLQTDRDRILEDQTNVSGIQNQAFESVQNKLTETEMALKREQDAVRQLKQEMFQRQESLESERKNLMDALANSQKKCEDEKRRSDSLSNQIRSCKSNLQVAHQELADYKDKAARILQSKERLIASLREGPGASGESAGVSQLEYEALKQERDMFKEEINQLKMQLENLKTEMQDTEIQHQTELYSIQEEMRVLQDSFSDEKRKNADILQELDSSKQEVQCNVDDMCRQKTAMQQRIDEREREINKLRIQLTTKSMNTVTETELEERVRALTESLIQKQTTLETLSSEKNSLYLQLERLNHKYEELQNITSRNSATVVVSEASEDNELRHRYPELLREKINDAEVTRRMKRAAKAIDRFSIRIGAFLRRYPIARVFVIIYMFILHIWVTIVLVTYKPEIHGSDFQPKAPK